MNTVFHLRVGTLGTLPTAESQVHVQGPFPLTLPASYSQCEKAESSARGGDRDGVATGSKGGGGNDGQTERPSSSSLPRSRESRGAMPAVPSSPPPHGPQPPQAPQRTLTAQPSLHCLVSQAFPASLPSGASLGGPPVPSGPSDPVSSTSTAHPPTKGSKSNPALSGGRWLSARGGFCVQRA